MAQKAIPTLHLRGVNYKTLSEKIARGEYTIVRAYEPRPLKLETKNMEQSLVVGKTETDPVYERIEKGVRKKIYTTNVQLYNEAVKRLTQTIPPTLGAKPLITDYKVKRCSYCRRALKDDNYVLSIIVQIERDDEKTFFHGYDAACNPGCAYTQLQIEKRLNPQNAFYVHAEANFKYYVFCASETTVMPELMPNWRLLDENGGSMTSTEFDANIHPYKRLDAVVMLPMKLQFE